MSDQPGSHDAAFDVYRLAWLELFDLQQRPQPQHIQIYMDEMKEALLDLKQATLAGDHALKQRYSTEVLVLLVELRRLASGE